MQFVANFQLPVEGPLFDTVEYTEGLEKEEAQKLVETYNKEARAILPPPEKRRYGDRDRYGDNKYGQYLFSFATFSETRTVLRMLIYLFNSTFVRYYNIGL